MKENLQEILDICNKIDLPKSVVSELSEVIENYDFSEIMPYFNRFIDHEPTLYTEINERFASSENLRIVWLALFLNQSRHTFKNYQKLGIDEQIFIDTMRAFRRFLDESLEKYGKYVFDREHWAGRHINMVLFRLGELEFEFKGSIDDVEIDGKYIVKKGQDIITIHIPSDANLTAENCEKSYKTAREFVKKFYPEYKNCYFMCKTWLLSPDLVELLSKNSKIMQFQSFYTIYASQDSEQYKNWLFGQKEMEISEYPEQTSLQKAVKSHLLNGGKIRIGSGIIL